VTKLLLKYKAGRIVSVVKNSMYGRKVRGGKAVI
jgi:hypothetical protein